MICRGEVCRSLQSGDEQCEKYAGVKPEIATRNWHPQVPPASAHRNWQQRCDTPQGNIMLYICIYCLRQDIKALPFYLCVFCLSITFPSKARRQKNIIIKKLETYTANQDYERRRCVADGGCGSVTSNASQPILSRIREQRIP